MMPFFYVKMQTQSLSPGDASQRARKFEFMNARFLWILSKSLCLNRSFSPDDAQFRAFEVL
jgi:hypothetical protein